ncbi:long-chain-fatty-acid--CoA ligase ACSBG2-like isoform X1 [Dysidea avara]|uniref:long-chain-fatty-acid--CoA ligase ACSBG2-like isoform X1 n=1 Tax=Dysidea avara TaxID=196820 RepID=UPI003318FE96
MEERLTFQGVRKKLGLDRCRFQVTGAAPIDHSVVEFFMQLDVPICEMYGMSECTGPHTVSLPCFLTITGRIKEILVTKGGENVVPVPVESLMKEELPLLSHCCVIGNDQKYLTMLVTFKCKVTNCILCVKFLVYHGLLWDPNSKANKVAILMR